MKIYSTSESYPYQAMTASGRAVQKTAELQSAAKDGGGDTVAISPRGAFQVRLEGETRRYAAAARQSAQTSTARMEELKQKYQGDSCPVSGMDVTRAMLERVCGPRV